MIRRVQAVEGLPTRKFPWATTAGRLLVLSGIVALDAEGRLVGQDDPSEQARQAFRNLGLILAACGTSFAEIVHIRCYATTAAAFNAYVEEKSRQLGSQPAATSVLVAGLMLPGSALELDVLALRKRRATRLKLL